MVLSLHNYTKMKLFPKILIEVYSIWFVLYFNFVLSLDISSRESTLHEYVGRTIESFKLRLHNTLENNRLRRTRSISEQDGTAEYSNEVPNLSLNQLESSENISSVVVWCKVTVNDTEVVFAGTNDGHISILYEFELISLHKVSSNEPIYSLMGFQHGNGLWLVALHVEKENGHFMQIYEYDYKTIKLRQHINLPGYSLISIVTIEGTPYLVLVTNKEFKEDSKLVLFVWTGTQFDEILMLSLQSKCRHLVVWQMDKVLFFAASLYDKSQLTIWRFTKYYGKFIPVQVLEGKFHVLKHFEYAGSNYLICGMENKVVIFWWSGVTFLKQQEFYSTDSDYIADISTLILSQEGALIIAVKNNQLEYFLQGSSISYVRTHSITLDSPTLRSSTLWKDEDGSFYILPVFQDPHPMLVFELKINFKVSPPFLDITSPQNCSEDFYEVVKERRDQIFELHSKIGKVWRKDKPVFVSSVNVQGSVVSNDADITSVVFSKSPVVPKYLSIFDIYYKLNKHINNLQYEIQNAVWKSVDQDISSNINFMKGIQMKEGNIEKLSDHAKINEVHTLAFPSVLRINGNNIFLNNISFGKTSATFIYSKILNNVQVKDYLLLDRKETISGNLIFQDITVKDMTISNNINDLELRNIVTTSGQQNIENKKFLTLSSKSLKSRDRIADVKSLELEKILQNNAPELDMELSFTSVITVGNITLHTINGLPLMNLFLKSMKMSGNENVQGPKHFTYPLNVMELIVLGYVNQLNLDHLLTLHTSQNISNNIEFTNVSFTDIETHSLNEIDLCSEAILKCGHFKVNKTVKFMKPLTVSFINMEDGVHINSVDFSNVPSLMSQTRYVNESVVISSISVNDVQIEDKDFSFLINELATNVWLKKIDQTISEGNFKLLSANDLNVQTVNGISFDDIALTDGNATFKSSKHFGNISVGSLTIQDGKTLNNIFITSNMILAMEKGLSTLSVKDMSIKGDLIAHAINDIAFSNLMHIQRMQNCNGINTFHDIRLDYLKADKLDFSAISGTDFDGYKQTAVLSIPNKKVFNKTFKCLEGQGIITRGFLNDKEFEEMRKSVVTLNSKQTISHINFGEIKTVALSITNFDIVDLSKVILKDTPNYKFISSKKFTGKVTVKDMVLNGKLEEVDIKALHEYAFYKGKDNSILHPAMFLTDLKAKTVQIPLYSTVDGIVLDDLISLNRNYYLTFLHFSTIQLKNVDIYGEINDCDLWDIVISKNCTKIMAVKHITHLKVDGNLFIESMINQIPRYKLSEIFSNIDLDVYSNTNFYFSSITTMHLQTVDINDIQIDVLIEDTVGKHIPEVIKGKKSFKNQLFTSTMSIDALKVTILCGLNIPFLYNKYVSRQREQKISIRNLNQVKARNVTIKGTLNGIKLPDDVVLTHTEENMPITSFNSSIYFLSDLNIYGTINDIDLAQLVDNRVNLNSSETVVSTLVFLEDIYTQDLVIKGLVNEILLLNTVKSIDQNSIQGFKVFQENLVLQSNLFIDSSINQISKETIYSLFMNICLKDENETISSMVNFTGIETSHLRIERINGISLEDLWNAIAGAEKNSHGMIQNFSNTNLEEMELLLKIKEKILDIFPFYGFFELHQVLPHKSTIQFLPMYESGISGDDYELPTYKMVVWTNQNESCRLYKYLEMAVSPDGILTSLQNRRVFQGRMFPFPLRLYDRDIKLFTLHTDKRKSCTIARPNSLETVFRNGHQKTYKFSVTPNYIIMQAQILELEDGIYMLIAYSFEGDGDRMYLYQYNQDNGWRLHNKFHSWGDVSSFDIILNEFTPTGIHLAVTNARNNSGIYHYQWDSENYMFEIKEIYLKSVSTAAVWVRHEDNIFLLLAKEKTRIKKDYNWAYVYTEPIEVHILEEDVLKLYHTINIKGISSFERFNFVGETYVLAVSNHLQAIYVLQYRGYNGFEEIQKINAPGVVRATVFSSKNDDLLLAISSISGFAKILKCIARGNLEIHS